MSTPNFNNMTEAQINALIKQGQAAKKSLAEAESSRIGTLLQPVVTDVLSTHGTPTPSKSGWTGHSVKGNVTIDGVDYALTLLVSDVAATDKHKAAIAAALQPQPTA